jgi:hypothetical protein
VESQEPPRASRCISICLFTNLASGTVAACLVWLLARDFLYFSPAAPTRRQAATLRGGAALTEGQGIFAPRNGLFTVLEVVGPRNYRLDTTGTHNVFHTDLLRPAGTDPFEHQKQDDWRPDPVAVTDDEGDEQLEYEVEKIVKEGTYRRKPAFQVKWKGYNKLEWTAAENMEGTTALEDWRALQQDK